MTATLPAPRRITIRSIAASLSNLLGRDPQHRGATVDWQPLAELPPPAVDLDPAVEHALTGEVLRVVEDELGRWVPDLYDLEPARLFDAVLYGTPAGQPFVNGVNTGRAA